MIRNAGTTVPLVTVDQPNDAMLAAGGLDGVLRTGSFGSRVGPRLETLRKHQPTGPLMCMEFWDGWFDYWGGRHHATSAADAAAELDALLATGASVNIYMFHGGTNFGTTSGANDKGVYRATVTSYDGLPVRSPVVVLAHGLRWTGLLPGQRLAVHGRLHPPRPGESANR